MAMKNDRNKRSDLEKSPALLTQKEIIQKINFNTHSTYKLIEILMWKYVNEQGNEN
jgi:hypothetical protein